ncbi:hypothetical protein [Micromonospora sp. NRRL B-16802]|uniref:hypothetical protein n=1 Tax=Micromonospora sp. NRRL B-16802 TaxID=1415541 RepID=UPI000A5DEA81|nr:hypothetical protein [Micromonospora sp. NRRL B-16802]
MIDESMFEGRPLYFCLKNNGRRLVITTEDGAPKEFKRSGGAAQPHDTFTFKGDNFRRIDGSSTFFSYWLNDALIDTPRGRKVMRNLTGSLPSVWVAA